MKKFVAKVLLTSSILDKLHLYAEIISCYTDFSGKFFHLILDFQPNPKSYISLLFVFIFTIVLVLFGRHQHDISLSTDAGSFCFWNALPKSIKEPYRVYYLGISKIMLNSLCVIIQLFYKFIITKSSIKTLSKA